MSLKTMRRANGWSQEQLSEISGVSIRTIQRLEAGDAPGLETQKALAAAFNQSLEDLHLGMGGADSMDGETENPDTAIYQNVIQYGWKGLLFNILAMMVFITWLLFLSNQFGIDRELIGFVGFMWGSALFIHVMFLLVGKK